MLRREEVNSQHSNVRIHEVKGEENSGEETFSPSQMGQIQNQSYYNFVTRMTFTSGDTRRGQRKVSKSHC